MKKIKMLSMSLIVVATLLVFRVFATDVQVDTGGWTKVGENEIQILKLDINDAVLTTGGNFAKRTNKLYSVDEYNNGTYDSQRNSEVSYNHTYNTGLVVYTQALQAGTNSNLGSFSLKWTGAAKLQDGTECDVKVTVDNITIKNNQATTKPVEILYNFNHEDNIMLGVATRYAKQEVSVSELDAENRIPWSDIGAKYDISFEITKKGTNEKVENKNMVFSFYDLDQPDKTTGGDASFTGTYAEGITLVSGVSDKVYLDSNHVLRISNTSFGNNTRYSATGGTDSESENKSGFATRFNSSNLKYTWTGSDCGTGTGYMPVKKVLTSTSGLYPNNIHIAPKDEEVFWKEDKRVYFHTDLGYKLSKVTVTDDTGSKDVTARAKACPTTCQGVDKTQCEEHKNVQGTCYYYEFTDVIKDYAIDVQCIRQDTVKVITRVEGEGGRIEGDETVEYGKDSTPDKIKMQADKGYVISKVTINGKEVSISENLESLTLPNFKSMTEDKLVVVSFKPKPTTVVVDKTSANTPMIIQAIGISSILIAAVVAYLYKTGKIALFFKPSK